MSAADLAEPLPFEEQQPLALLGAASVLTSVAVAESTFAVVLPLLLQQDDLAAAVVAAFPLAAPLLQGALADVAVSVVDLAEPLPFEEQPRLAFFGAISVLTSVAVSEPAFAVVLPFLLLQHDDLAAAVVVAFPLDAPLLPQCDDFASALEEGAFTAVPEAPATPGMAAPLTTTRPLFALPFEEQQPFALPDVAFVLTSVAEFELA